MEYLLLKVSSVARNVKSRDSTGWNEDEEAEKRISCVGRNSGPKRVGCQCEEDCAGGGAAGACRKASSYARWTAEGGCPHILVPAVSTLCRLGKLGWLVRDYWDFFCRAMVNWALQVAAGSSKESPERSPSEAWKLRPRFR